MKIFLDKPKQQEYTASKPTLQEMLKDFLPGKSK